MARLKKFKNVLRFSVKINSITFRRPTPKPTRAKDFIDKFWIALGWDVNHDTQTNPYEQDVKVERKGKKKPDEIRQMRFADIACGSGSFLLGVYDLLLRHRTAYYNANKRNRNEGLKAGCREHNDGTLHLSLWQKREVLLNNITVRLN
jgi:hypothetical protein